MAGFCSSHGCGRYSMNISWIVCACEKKIVQETRNSRQHISLLHLKWENSYWLNILQWIFMEKQWIFIEKQWTSTHKTVKPKLWCSDILYFLF